MKKRNSKCKSCGKVIAKDKKKIVMDEFKMGKLKSSSGQNVTNPKQAVAIAYSEARRAKRKSKK